MKVSGTAERHLERSWRHLEGFWNLEWAGTVERVGPWSRVRALEEAEALDGRAQNGVLDKKKFLSFGTGPSPPTETLNRLYLSEGGSPRTQYRSLRRAIAYRVLPNPWFWFAIQYFL